MLETMRETPERASFIEAADSRDWSDSPTMQEQTSGTSRTGTDADLSPRWALERAELQSDVDALVHQVLAGLLKSAEDLKQRIRDETAAELEQSRQERDALRAEAAAARLEFDQVRASQQAAVQADIERERDSILAQAREEAAQIVRNAQAEREQMLSEIRATETRLRGLQEQIQSLLSFGGNVAAAAPSVTPAPAPWTPQTPQPSSYAPVETEVPTPSATMPPVPTPAETPVIPEAPAPPTNFSGLIDTAPEAPAPVEPAVPSAPSGPRTLQLIFTNVPGYQQAAAIERATRQLSDVSGVDVQEFERGRLVLEVQAGNPAALVDQMVSNAPAAMSVAEQSGDSITFQLS